MRIKISTGLALASSGAVAFNFHHAPSEMKRCWLLPKRTHPYLCHCVQTHKKVNSEPLILEGLSQLYGKPCFQKKRNSSEWRRLLKTLPGSYVLGPVAAFTLWSLFLAGIHALRLSAESPLAMSKWLRGYKHKCGLAPALKFISALWTAFPVSLQLHPQRMRSSRIPPGPEPETQRPYLNSESSLGGVVGFWVSSPDYDIKQKVFDDALRLDNVISPKIDPPTDVDKACAFDQLYFLKFGRLPHYGSPRQPLSK